MNDGNANERKDETFFANYYNSIPSGDRCDFLLVVRIVLGGSEMRWLKRIAAWRTSPTKRKLHMYEIEKLTHLVTDERWRDTLTIIRHLLPG